MIYTCRSTLIEKSVTTEVEKKVKKNKQRSGENMNINLGIVNEDDKKQLFKPRYQL